MLTLGPHGLGCSSRTQSPPCNNLPEDQEIHGGGQSSLSIVTLLPVLASFVIVVLRGELAIDDVQHLLCSITLDEYDMQCKVNWEDLENLRHHIFINSQWRCKASGTDEWLSMRNPLQHMAVARIY